LLSKISVFPDILPRVSLDITVKQETQCTRINLKKQKKKKKKKEVTFNPETRFTIGKCKMSSHPDIEVTEAAKVIADRTERESEHKNNQIQNRVAKTEDIELCNKRIETLWRGYSRNL
jgi:hypothetical protein